jgi:hypothetical protein
MKNKKSEEENDTFTKVESGEIVEVDSFTGNESKFDTLVWKFDKNYKFISTSIND